jgi:hypothetical protein
MRRTISPTYLASSARVMVAGMQTRSTSSTWRACTVLRRRALRTTSTCIGIGAEGSAWRRADR